MNNRGAAVCCLVLVLVVPFTGCGAEKGADKPGPGGVVVGPNGFDVSQSGVHVSAGPGVAPEGTAVSVTVSDDQGAVQELPRVGSASTVVQVALGDGDQQPQQPVSITLPIAASVDVDKKLAAGDLPVIVAKGSSGNVELLDAQWDSGARTFSAQTSHLSDFFAAFVAAGDALREVGKFFDTLAKQRFPKPDCPQTANVAGVDYGISPVTHDAAWPCVENRNDQLALTLHSNSGQIYRVRTAPAAKGETTNGVDVTNILTSYVYDATYSNVREIEGLLPPGGSVAFQFPGNPPTRGELLVEPVLVYVGITFNIVKTIAAVRGGDLEAAIKKAEVVDCVGSLAETWRGIQLDQLMETLGVNAKALADCFGPALDLQGGKRTVLDRILDIIGSPIPVLTTLVTGLFNSLGELVGQDTANKAEFTVSATRPIGEWVGTWRGKVTGDNAPGGDYDVSLELFADGDSLRGRVSYPALECGGDWTEKGRTGITREFEEVITYEGSCVDVVQLRLTHNGDSLVYEITAPSNKKGVKATLTRG